MNGKKAKEIRRQKEGQLQDRPDSISSPAPTTRKTLTGSRVEQLFSGPLPPPAVLREYDTIIADGAERLLSLVEREQHNRHVQEQAVTVATIEDAQAARKADLRGDILAFAVFFLCLASGLSCASLGHLKLAASLMGAPVITAIASWIAKRKQRA